MSTSTMTIADLCLSPYNVRTNAHDATAIAGMAQSLLSRGQLYPLAVHPMPRRGRARQIWGVLAGGRRFRAFEHLIAQGALPASHPIDVVVRDIRDEAELVELSLAENLVRVDLRPYEVFAAVHRAHAHGRSFAEIAETNGQTIDTVRRWARLGALEPTIFAALEAGEISQEQARAFAATEDQALQLWAFEMFSHLSYPHQRRPEAIRQLLKVGDHEQRRLLRFVGEAAYREAGGRYELDLFADQAEERGRVVDEGLLMQLVEAKLAAARDRLRAQAGAELRFEADYPRDGAYGGVALDLEIEGRWDDREPADAERLAFLDDEMAEHVERARQALSLTDSAERQRAIAAIDVEYLPLEKEAEAIERRRRLHLPAGDVFATLRVEDDGQLEVRFWWASRKAMAQAQKAGQAEKRPVSAGPVRKPAQDALAHEPVTGGAALARNLDWKERQRADAQIREAFGLTMEAVQHMRALRRTVLRCALVTDAWEGDGAVGLDYLLWSLARDRFGPMCDAREHERGIAGFAPLRDSCPAEAAEMAACMPGGTIWANARESLRGHPSMTEPDLVEAFRAFRCEDWEWKSWAAAVVAGAMVVRSANADGYRVPLHDELARLCGWDSDDAVRAVIDPDEAFVALLPRAQRLELAEPHVDGATFRGWAKLKTADLVAPVARALRHARAFVHPMLRFAPAPAGDDQHPHAEKELAA